VNVDARMFLISVPPRLRFSVSCVRSGLVDAPGVLALNADYSRFRRTAPSIYWCPDA